MNDQAVHLSVLLPRKRFTAPILLLVRTSESFFAAIIDGCRVADDDCLFGFALDYPAMCSPAVPGSALLAGVRLAAAVLLCVRTSVLLPTATDDGRGGAGDGCSALDFALTFHCEVVLVVLADVVLPRHRDIIFLQQNRGCCHAIIDVLKEIAGPEGVLVRRADPCSEA